MKNKSCKKIKQYGTIIILAGMVLAPSRLPAQSEEVSLQEVRKWLKADKASLTDKDILNLDSLNLDRFSITSRSLVHLDVLKNLKKLIFSRTRVTSEGLVYLEKLPRLEYLDLESIFITDDKTAPLENLKSLKELYLPYTVSDTMAEHLQTALPGCRIHTLLSPVFGFSNFFEELTKTWYIVLVPIGIFLFVMTGNSKLYQRFEKKLNERPGAGTIGILAGILFLAGCVLVSIRPVKFILGTVPAEGKVIKLIPHYDPGEGPTERFANMPGSFVFHPKIKFTTRKGEEIIFRSRAGSNPPARHVGEKIKILYSPANPSEVIDKTFMSIAFLFIWSILLGLPGMYYLGGGIIRLRSDRAGK